jgi:hypothetical protein
MALKAQMEAWFNPKTSTLPGRSQWRRTKDDRVATIAKAATVTAVRCPRTSRESSGTPLTSLSMEDATRFIDPSSGRTEG